MNCRMAICDDENEARAHMHTLAKLWAQSNGHSLIMLEFPSAEAFWFHYEDDKQFDILLLDVEMGDMNGVTLARRVRAGNREVQIIFATGFMEYIADGYEVDALHYLLKPVTSEKLCAVLDRAAEKLARNARTVLLSTAEESVRVPLYEIAYAEVRRNYVTVHADADYTVKTTLSELEKQLDAGFIRVGRSFIVNLRRVRRVGKTELLLSDGARIPMPRGAFDAVNRAMVERL